MSSLSPEQQRYVNQRLAQIRWWNRLGWLLAVAVVAAYAWLWQTHPAFVDPARVLEKVRAGGVTDVELARLAALGNLAFLGCGVLLLGMVGLTYAAMWTEAATIRRLTPASGAPDDRPNA